MNGWTLLWVFLALFAVGVVGALTVVFRVAAAQPEKKPKTALEEELRKSSRQEWWAALALIVMTLLWWVFVPDGFGEARLQSLVPYGLALFFLMQWGWSRDVGKVLRGLVEWEWEAKRERERILAEFENLNYRLDKLERLTTSERPERSEMEAFHDTEGGGR